MNCALCIELTLFGCKFTQKIRISILFSQKSHIRYPFFIEIQHKTHPIRNTPNMHIFSKSVHSSWSEAQKNILFFLKTTKHTIFTYISTLVETLTIHSSTNPLSSSKLSRKRLTHIIINTKNRDLQSLQSLQSQVKQLLFS